MDIFPSLLTHSPDELHAQLVILLPHFDKMQIDVADNVLVEGITPTTFEALQQLFLIPEIKNTSLDFHLMVKDFQKDLSLLQEAHSRLNIRFALVHEAANPPLELFHRQPYAFKVGLVLNPEETIEIIQHKYSLDKIPVIQIMTIVPGAQGRPFIPNLLNKIDQLRNIDYRGIIMLDGAINDTTLPVILRNKYRPDVVCPGSYFSKFEDVESQLKKLTEEITRTEVGS